MNKAFIFDMDGVLIDTEKEWSRFDPVFLSSILPGDIYEKIGDTLGFSIKAVYDKAIALGAQIDKDSYVRAYDDAAAEIYGRAPLTAGTQELVSFLVKNEHKIGLVSAAQQKSINLVLARLSFSDKFDVVLSVNDHPDLKQKPHPDAYAETLKELDSNAGASFILEDSNPGIVAAKAAGAYTIGYRGNLLPGYEQTGADADADTMDDVIRLVEARSLAFRPLE